MSKDHRRTEVVCFYLWDNVMKDQRKINTNAIGFQVNTKRRGTNEQQEGKEYESRRWEVENTKIQKDIWNWLGRFMKLLEVKVHCHEIEVCHTCQVGLGESWTISERFMKLVKHSSNIIWNVHELAWNLYVIESALLWSHLTKGVIYGFLFPFGCIQHEVNDRPLSHCVQYTFRKNQVPIIVQSYSML